MLDRIAHGSLSSARGAPPLNCERPQRVLFFGKNMSRSRCTGGLVEALRGHGLVVEWLNMATMRRWSGNDGAQRRAERVFATFRPDLVLVFHRDLPLELLRDFGREAMTALWIEEPLDDLDTAMVEYMAAARLVCLSNPGPRAWLHTQGVRHIAFLMSGFSPHFHAMAPTRRRLRDVVFIGGPGRQGQRARFLAEVSRHFHTEIYGVRRPWEEWIRHYPMLRVHRPVDNVGFRKLCATSRIVLGLNQVNHAPLYFSNRTFLTLACGGFHLTHYVPGLESVFGDREHLVWYHSAEECLGKIRRYLDADTEREQIARRGTELVLRQHQYSHRVERILAILQGRVPAEPMPTRVVEARTPVPDAATMSAITPGI